MALLQQHYEGQANATGVTVANSTTYGDAPASRVDAINGTVNYSTADAMHGSRSVALTMNTGAANTTLDIGLGSQNTTSLATRCYMKLGSVPSSPVRIVQLRSTISADMGGVNFYSDGTVAATDITGAVLSRSSASTQVINPATWYRFEMAWNISQTVGSYAMGVYVGDSTSPWFSYTSPTTMNTGTAAIGEVRVGKASNTGTIGNPWHLDDFAISNGTTTFIGPYASTGPAISTVQTPSFFEIDATGSTAAAGGALSYAISPSVNTAQSPSGVFYVPQTTSSTSYTLTVSEAGGGSTSRSIVVPGSTSASSSQTTVMVQKFIAGAWS